MSSPKIRVRTDEQRLADENFGPLVRLQQVSKIFRSEQLETYALDTVDLEIANGQFVAITGPSGCGKSTLLSIMGLMESPTLGSFWLDGQDVTAMSLAQLARCRNRLIGFVFQDFNLIGDLTVLDNVSLPLGYGGVARGERQQRAAAALDQVGMQSRSGHYPSQLSGGQQQRAAIARAIVAEPRLLLADEPTGNLDTENGTAVMELIAQIHAAGTTVCLVTHDETHADYSQRRIKMLDGKFVVHKYDL